jgi:hypothetical protein
VIIGEMLFFNLKMGLPEVTRWELMAGYFRDFREMTLMPFSLTTGKDRKISTVLIGMMIGLGKSHSAAPRFRDIASEQDRRLTLLAISPRSVMDFVILLIRFLNRSKWRAQNLPDSLGLIRSSSVAIQALRGANFKLDDIENAFGWCWLCDWWGRYDHLDDASVLFNF